MSGAGRVEGKVALITGAARGQGRAHAVRLAEEGADIIALDNCRDVETVPYPGATEDDLTQTVKLVEATDRRIALEAAVRQAVATFGGIDIVIANAGIATFGATPGSALALDERTPGGHTRQCCYLRHLITLPSKCASME